MRRGWATGGSLAAVLCFAAGSGAGAGDDPPLVELTPPTLKAAPPRPAAQPPDLLPTPPLSVAAPGPGSNEPAATATAPVLAVPLRPSTPGTPAPLLPDLIGPEPLAGSGGDDGLGPLVAPSATGRRGSGGLLQSTPAGPDVLSLEPDDGKPPRTGNRDEPTPPGPRPRRGLLGRLLGGPLERPARVEPRSELVPDDDPIAVSPRSDPAIDAALKRRIESQIRRTMAEQVHDVEVRVVDRRVRIKAKANRFWQRRAVRRQLETLPGLSGYRAEVLVD